MAEIVRYFILKYCEQICHHYIWSPTTVNNIDVDKKNSASTAFHSAQVTARGIQMCILYDRETFTSFFLLQMGDHSEIRTRNIGVRSNRLYRGGTQGPD